MKGFVERTIDSLDSRNINRNLIVEYIFKYKFGNKLPRVKRFNKLRIVESFQGWGDFLNSVNCEVEMYDFKHRISPFLLNQKALLTFSHINNQSELSVDSILDVIKKLEGVGGSSSTDLVKNKVKFSNKGLLKGYKHHHIPLLPNAYLAMFSKRDRNGNMVNLESMNLNFDVFSGAMDIFSVENEIKSRGESKGGRMTGHWLITKTIDNDEYYLGVFPHSNGKHDDKWIKNLLIESERVMALMNKRN